MREREHVGNHRPDWRVTVAGIELEITYAHGEGHARPISLDYLERTGRGGFTASDISAVERMPTDLARHKARIREAEEQGRELPPSTRLARPMPRRTASPRARIPGIAPGDGPG